MTLGVEKLPVKDYMLSEVKQGMRTLLFYTYPKSHKHPQTTGPRLRKATQNCVGLQRLAALWLCLAVSQCHHQRPQAPPEVHSLPENCK